MGIWQDIYLTRKPLAGFVAIGIAWATCFAQMPAIKAAVGASDGVYGAAILCSALGSLLAMGLAPQVHRVLGGRALQICIVLIGLGMFGAGFASGIPALVAAMFVAAAGSGTTDVLINARVSELESRSARSLMSLNHALYSFAYAGAALLTGALRAADWPPAAIFSVLLVALCALAWASRDMTARSVASEEQGSTDVPQKLVMAAGFVVLVAFLAEASTEGWSALHLERTLGGSPAQGAMGPALLGLTMGIGRMSGHALVQVMKDTTLMAVAMAVSACGLVVAGMAGSVGLALAGFALAGLGISVVAPLTLALVGRTVDPAARLKAISRVSVLGYGAFFMGPPLMGFIAEGFGLRASFGLIAVLLVVASVVLVPALVRQVR